MRLRDSMMALFLSGMSLAASRPVIAQSAPAFPLPDQSSHTRRTLAGSVVNSLTGEPLRRALVMVNGSDPHSAFTGPDGHFTIPDVLEGQVFLTAQKPGYFGDGNPPNRTSSLAPQRPPATVTVGPSTPDIVLRLVPVSKIAGHVMDNAGQPIESLPVQLLARTIIRGRREWQQRGMTNTDDTGAYAFENLAAGSYALRSLSVPETETPRGIPIEGSVAAEVFPGGYYPQAPDLASAQPLELGPGQELPVDFALAPVPGFFISGVIGGAKDGVSVLCEDGAGNPVSQGMRTEVRKGRFHLGPIPPGSWSVHAFSRNGRDSAAEAEEPVEIAASDIRGLVLNLEPLPSIPVLVRNANGSGGLALNLTATSGVRKRDFRAFREPGQPEGSLAVRNVPPGKYWVRAQSQMQSSCIDTLTSGSVDLTREALTVLAGSAPAPIEVTLRNDCATISGSVQSAGEITPAAAVILLGGSSLDPPDPIHLGTSGKFSFPNLTPGAYRIFAFSDISNLEYANPEVLRDFTGREITIAPNETATVQVELITRGK